MLKSLWTDLIDGPFIWLLLILTAVLTSSLIVRYIPAVKNSINNIENNRKVSIDGLRGFLGVSVFVHHTVVMWFFLQNGQWSPPPSRFIVHAGQTSVALFFMITSFLFWQRVIDLREKIDWASFIFARVFRLYPVYLFTLMLIVFFSFITANIKGYSGPVLMPLLEWITMLRAPDLNGVPNTSLMIAGVTWTLSYEWLFYLCLPMLGFLTAFSQQPLIATLSALAVVILLYIHNFSYVRLIPFIGGIAAAHYVKQASLVKAANSRVAAIVAVGALSIVVIFSPTAYDWKPVIGLTIFFTIVASGNDLWGVLRRPSLIWLGDITYSIYLLHGLFLWVVFNLWWPGIRDNGAYFIVATVLLDIIIVFCTTVTFLKIERQGIQTGRRTYQRILRMLGQTDPITHK